MDKCWNDKEQDENSPFLEDDKV